MNNQEAKFILSAYRPDGRDATDGAFQDALSQARHDPELGRWLEQQRHFDSCVAGQLRSISPPPGLREAILAGTRASTQRAQRRWWSKPVWLGAAAAVLVLGATWYSFGSARPDGTAFVAFALQELAESHDAHSGLPAGLERIQAQFSSTSLPLRDSLRLDQTELRLHGCRTLTYQGREIFEVCIQRDGKWFHLYAARRSDIGTRGLESQTLVTTQGRFASAVWQDSDLVYALVTDAGADTLRRLI